MTKTIPSRSNSFTTTVAGDTIVTLPLLATDSNYINGFIEIRLNGNVYMNLYRGGDYSIYSFNAVVGDSIDADKAAMQMMILNKIVFGYTKFKINDNRLFSNATEPYSTHGGRIFTLNDSLPSSNNLGVILCQQCYSWICSICYGLQSDCPQGGYGVRCVTDLCDGPEPGDGPGGGGGGPTGGGGDPSPTFPCPSSQNRGLPPPTCGPTPFPQPIVPIPDEIAAPCDPFITIMQSNAAFLSKMDELNLINGNTQMEKGYKIGDFNAGISSYIDISGNLNEKFINVSLVGGELVSGLMHTHYNGLAPMFSPEDVTTFARYFLNGNARDPKNLFFTLNTSNGNSYLLKVSDTAKFRIFANKIAGDSIKYSSFLDKYNRIFSNPPTNFEIEFLKMMKDENVNKGFEIYTGDAMHEWRRMSLTGSPNAAPGAPNAYAVYLKKCFDL